MSWNAKRNSANRIALGMCIYFVLLSVAYAAATPPFEPPDEASHFLYIHNIIQTGDLPILEDREIVFKSQSVQRHHPPLYYLIGAFLISGTERQDIEHYLQPNPLASIGVVADNNQNAYLHEMPQSEGDTARAVWILRLYSITLAVGTVWFIYLSASLVGGKSSLGLLSALLIISIPSFVHISASINNDNLVTFFHAAGVYMGLRMWWRKSISLKDVTVISLILSGVALTKINGLTLLPILYGWAMLGILLKRFRWQQVFTLVAVSLIVIGVLSGWWYIRNMKLYGDPLALTATLRIWARGGPPVLISIAEAKGVWDSFWFTLGNLNIRGPEWLYGWYLPSITILGFVGLSFALWRCKQQRIYLLYLLTIGCIAILAMLVATSRINVSQGRILFPGLIAYAPLLVIGWFTLLGRWGGLIVLPLVVVTVTAPSLYIAPAFSPARMVDNLPMDLYLVEMSSSHLTIHGYDLANQTIEADGQVQLTVYISGAHPENPYLFVKAVHPLTQQILGGIDTYAGMMPTQSLIEGQIYAVPIQFRLDAEQIAPMQNPFQVQLVMGWRVPETDNPAEGRYLLLGSAGSFTEAIVVRGPTLIPSQLPNFIPQFEPDVVYGQHIRLSGYSLSDTILSAGNILTVMLKWEAVSPIEDDWTVAIGLLDENMNIITQADGMPEGYPTSAWRPEIHFIDERTLRIPEDTSHGNYHLYIGWYRLSDGRRLQPAGDGVETSLYLHPSPITVR